MSAPAHLPPVPPASLPAIRLHLLRIAADLAPRLTGGVRADDVLERARALELYVFGPQPGSAEASGPASPERGAPEHPPPASASPPATGQRAATAGSEARG